MSCKPKLCLGDLKHGIEIVRRSLVSAAPGTAEPAHEYVPVFATRAQIKTKSGVSQWNRVEIDGKSVTHTMTIRYTPISFDVRDRVRAGGELFAILAIENVDEANDWLRLHCALAGAETAAAAR